MRARLRMTLLVGVIAAFAAALTAGTAAAAPGDAGLGKSLHRNYVNPLVTPAQASGSTSVGGNYGLFTCQVGLSSIPGRQCYDPYQMQRAYGVDSLISGGYDGTGKTIVIVDAFDGYNVQSNFDTFNTFYGLPAQTITQLYPGGPTPPNAGWSQEMQLDVDWSHAIAPGAKIVLVHGLSNSDQDLVDALNYAVNNNLGDVVSMSFGEGDTCLGSTLQGQWHQAFVNATKKGITLFASSGDQGAAQPSCDGNSWSQLTSSPASDPLVSGVGGTELHAADYCLTFLGCDPLSNPQAGTWLSEIGWNEGPPYGDFQPYFGSTEASGGGYSTVWKEPSYQEPVVPNHKPKGRAVPDVSYNGAVLHGVLVYLGAPFTPGFYTFGGTSAGAPQWAALTAIADQQAGHDYGFINDALYKLSKHSDSYAGAFHDITMGNNNALEYDSSSNPVTIAGFNAGTGWDAVTGLGSPMAGGVLTGLSGYWNASQGNAAINSSKNG